MKVLAIGATNSIASFASLTVVESFASCSLSRAPQQSGTTAATAMSSIKMPPSWSLTNASFCCFHVVLIVHSMHVCGKHWLLLVDSKNGLAGRKTLARTACVASLPSAHRTPSYESSASSIPLVLPQCSAAPETTARNCGTKATRGLPKHAAPWNAAEHTALDAALGNTA